MRRSTNKKTPETLELKNTIAELKNLIKFQHQTQPYRSQNQIEYRTFEIIQSEEQKEKMEKGMKANKTMRHNQRKQIHLIGIPEIEDKKDRK